MRVFVSYSAEDEDLKKGLLKHLAPAVRKGTLSSWDRSQVRAGDAPATVIAAELASAQVALVLLSASYLDRDGPADEDLGRIAERQAAGGLRVVPVVLSACAWRDEPRLRDLQVLPRDGQPIRSRRDRDAALAQVCHELAALAPALTAAEPAAQPRPTAGGTESTTRPDPAAAEPAAFTWPVLLLTLGSSALLLASLFFRKPQPLRCLFHEELCLKGQAATPPAGEPTTALPTPPDLAEPAFIELPIKSTPPGARVRNADNEPLPLCPKTPCRILVPAHTPLELHLDKPGFTYQWKTDDPARALQSGGVSVHLLPIKLKASAP